MPSTGRKFKCKECWHWDNTHWLLEHEDSIWGFCRKKICVALIDKKDGKLKGYWPLVDQDSTCGERFKPE